MLDQEIKKFEPLIQGVVDLFFPYVEAAVHDLKTEKLILLYNNLSKRKVGDPTPIKELVISLEDFPEVFSPYYKTNWNGKQLKCTSITIRDKNKKPIGLICFNFDVSFFQKMHDQLSNLLKIKENAENPIDLHGKDARKSIVRFIQSYLQEEKLSIDSLTREGKKALVQHLYQKGVLNYKCAPTILAEELGISRATIYNYLE